MRKKLDVAIYCFALVMLLGTAALWWQSIAPEDQTVVLETGEKGDPPLSFDQGLAEPKGLPQDDHSRSEPVDILVHVAGAVQSPGVYTLKKGQRVVDALKMAVPRDDADLDLINLALPLQDAQQVYVPKKGEFGTPGGQTGKSRGGAASPAVAALQGESAAPSFPININSAGMAELELLPGIGPALAKAIIDYRQEVGGFSIKEDLVKVPGIGEKTLEKLSPLVTVGN